MLAFNSRTLKHVKVGDEVTDFRGTTTTLDALHRAEGRGFSGKVSLGYSAFWRNSNVADLIVIDEATLLPCGCPGGIVADEGHQEGCTWDVNPVDQTVAE